MGYICVVGGANVDIFLSPYKKLKLRDSNPGQLRISCGGVGRNIAENLARLGNDVKLLTVLGNDGNAELIKSNAKQCGIDLSHALTVEGNGGTYVSFNDVDGDMFVGFSAMDSIDNIAPDYLAANLDLLNGASVVVVDTNLTDGLEYLLDNVTAPLFLEAVSCAKVEKAAHILRNLTCCKLNHDEAQTLSGVDVVDETTAAECLARLPFTRSIYVSCGAKGVFCVDESGATFVPAMPSKAVNANGAGDSFFAGAIHGFVHGSNLVDSAKFGCVCGALTVACADTVCADLSCERVSTAVEEVYGK